MLSAAKPASFAHVRDYAASFTGMLDNLKEFFPPAVTWTHPKGGLFLWVTLPQGLDMAAIFKSAVEHNVVFVQGDSFYAHDGRENDGREGSRHMRLNFSNAAPEQIREGIRRLAAAVKTQLAATTLLPALPVGV